MKLDLRMGDHSSFYNRRSLGVRTCCLDPGGAEIDSRQGRVNISLTFPVCNIRRKKEFDFFTSEISIEIYVWEVTCLPATAVPKRVEVRQAAIITSRLEEDEDYKWSHAELYSPHLDRYVYGKKHWYNRKVGVISFILQQSYFCKK